MARQATVQPGHLAGELLKNLTSVKLVHVSYKGGPQAMADLIGGQIQLQFDVIATSLPHIKAGRTRALAVSSVKRSTILPEMPTIAETVPGFNMVGWQGFWSRRARRTKSSSGSIAKLSRYLRCRTSASGCSTWAMKRWEVRLGSLRSSCAQTQLSSRE